MELFSSVSPVYIMIEDDETLKKKVVPAHDYQAESYNKFISTTLITNKQKKLYNPRRGKHFKLQYTDKTNAPFYPKDAREDVVLVTLTRRDILNIRDTTTSIMSTDKAFLEQYAKILNNIVYIMIDEKSVKSVVPAHDYQAESYNNFISDSDFPITNTQKTKEYIHPKFGRNYVFNLKYTNKTPAEAPFYPKDAKQDVVLVDLIREQSGPISIMSTDKDFLEQYAKILNDNTQRNNNVYIIIKIDEKDKLGRPYKIFRAVPARDHQKNAYNDFIRKVKNRSDINTIIQYKQYGSFSLRYNFRMNDPNYLSYQENEYVLVDFIRDDDTISEDTISEMSSNEDFLKGRAAWMNRMTDGYGTGYVTESPDSPYSAGGRKSIRRKSIRRKSIRRKSIRRKSIRRKSIRRKKYYM